MIDQTTCEIVEYDGPTMEVAAVAASCYCPVHKQVHKKWSMCGSACLHIYILIYLFIYLKYIYIYIEHICRSVRLGCDVHNPWLSN